MCRGARTATDRHRFIGEESWAAGDQGALTHEPTWVVDPIDGTTNFCKGFPYVCISIGFVYNSVPTIGVLFAPFLGYLYYARHGHGAFMCSPMHPEPCRLPLNKPQPLPTFKQALIAFEWGSDRSPEVLDCKTRTYKRLVGDGSAGINGGLMALGVRSLGSAALNFAHVAMGCLDLYWEIGCWAWDVCAGIVIAQEAGCAVVGSKDVTRIALASPTSFGHHVPIDVLTGRKYVVVRKIANTPHESGSNAQKRIIGQFYDAVEEWDP